MILGVLPDPGVAVVDVCLHYVLVDQLWHDNKPLGQEVSLKHQIQVYYIQNAI